MNALMPYSNPMQSFAKVMLPSLLVGLSGVPEVEANLNACIAKCFALPVGGKQGVCIAKCKVKYVIKSASTEVKVVAGITAVAIGAMAIPQVIVAAKVASAALPTLWVGMKAAAAAGGLALL